MTAEIKNGEERLKPLARAYHWTSKHKLFDIEFGRNILLFDEDGRRSVNDPGLTPQRDIRVYENYEVVSQLGPYTFAFLGSPYPSEWKKYPEIYKTLLRRFDDPQLFTFDVFEADEPYVVDLGHGIPYFDKGGFSGEFFGGEGIKDYVASMTPLTEYKGGYVLPELLLPHHIPYERLRLIKDPKKLTRL